MLEYVPILSRAVQALDPNTEDTRRALYDRARRALIDRLRADPRTTDTVLKVEAVALDAAIEQVEADALRASDELPTEGLRAWRAQEFGRKWRRAIAGSAIGLVLLLAGGTVYALWPNRGPVARSVASNPAASEEPAKSIGYFYLRQPVYYRTSQPVGTIIVDKSQNFLYVVGPNVSALRYGIGIGPECSATAGLYRILRKEEWPGWKPTNGQTAPASEERKKIPFGARALYLSQDYRIHGSDGPAWIGRPVPAGCIRLVDDDVIHLYERAPLETRVVVNN